MPHSILELIAYVLISGAIGVAIGVITVVAVLMIVYGFDLFW